jgi:selenocysteine lyase/cysteine desulfurase
VNLDELDQILKKYNLENAYGKKRIRIVAISGASNVLGTFNEIQAISEIVHKYGARILVDGAQLVAHRAVHIDQWGIDYFAFSGHKVYAPFGSGALLVRKELVCLDPAELQKINVSGEDNSRGIAALGKAITLLQRAGMDIIEEKERILVRMLLKGLSGIKGLEVYGMKDPDEGNFLQKGAIVSFSLKKVPHNLVARELAERGGIGIRFGCFCTHLLIKHLLKLPPALQVVQNLILTLVPRVSNLIPGLVRVSIGIENETIDIERFIMVLEEIIHEPNSKTRNSMVSSLQPETRKLMEEFCETRIQKVYAAPH